MKPDEMRIKLAEACGWRFGPSDDDPTECWHKPHGSTVVNSLIIPDYPNDLNAIHEAEKVLTEVQWFRYTNTLIICAKADNEWDAFRRCAHATAAQRCEALLRTLGLWKEGV